MYKNVHPSKTYNSRKLNNLTVSEIRYIHALGYCAAIKNSTYESIK